MDAELGRVFVAPAASVTGQIVVDTTMVSVVTKVVLAVAGQLGTVVGQAVIVAVRVERTVEVVKSSAEDPEETVDWKAPDGAVVEAAATAVELSWDPVDPSSVVAPPREESVD